MSKSWHANWLSQVETPQRTALIQLLEAAPRSRREGASVMLSALPRPADADEASARVSTVIQYLTEGVAHATQE